MSATLVHNSSNLVTREQLRFIAPPAATDTWKPIAHYDLVQAIDRQLMVRDMRIVSLGRYSTPTNSPSAS